MKEERNKIIFIFDDEKDAKEVMAALCKKNDILWANDTKKAMLKADPKTMILLVSKSIKEVPKPIRI